MSDYPIVEIDDDLDAKPGEVRRVWSVSFSTGERSSETRLITDDRQKAEEEAAKKKGWYGATGHTYESTAVYGEDEQWYVGGTVYTSLSRRERALAKMTEEDKKALGLD
jgi:hypothetical protein